MKKILVSAVAFAFAAALGVIGACHKATPPELYPDRPLCEATTANACMAEGHDCNDSHGYACAHCEPANPSLDWCFLDGVTDGAHSDILAGRWYTCVSDCSLCGTGCSVARTDDGGGQ